jgi:hypothetical protein
LPDPYLSRAGTRQDTRPAVWVGDTLHPSARNVPVLAIECAQRPGRRCCDHRPGLELSTPGKSWPGRRRRSTATRLWRSWVLGSVVHPPGRGTALDRVRVAGGPDQSRPTGNPAASVSPGGSGSIATHRESCREATRTIAAVAATRAAPLLTQTTIVCVHAGCQVQPAFDADSGYRIAT